MGRSSKRKGADMDRDLSALLQNYGFDFFDFTPERQWECTKRGTQPGRWRI